MPSPALIVGSRPAGRASVMIVMKPPQARASKPASGSGDASGALDAVAQRLPSGPIAGSPKEGEDMA